MKEKTYKERDNEKARGKKRYQERVIEEHEAEKEIKEFDRHEDIPNESRTDRQYGVGFIYRERRSRKFPQGE
jgi:hypothetical protein